MRDSVCKRFRGQLLVLAIAILLASSFSGCGGDEGPQFGQVTGKVTLDGQPVPAGMVMFIPDLASGTTGPASQAQIGSDGQYVFEGPAGRQGALVGTHIVTVARLGSDQRFQRAAGIVDQATGAIQIRAEFRDQEDERGGKRHRHRTEFEVSYLSRR